MKGGNKLCSCNYTRKKIVEWDIDLIQEMSFQGGDGYQYFMNHDLAFASISRMYSRSMLVFLELGMTFTSVPRYGT